MLVFIPKSYDHETNLRRLAIFSPYLARQKGADSELVRDDESNIKFRYMLNIRNTDLVGGESYAMTVYNGVASSARLYRFEWEKGDDKDWALTNGAKHEIGTRNCNGKYFGFIKHNTTKHIMYTSTPSSSQQVFASLFCYDGRIFGYNAFRTEIVQDAGLTDNNTKNILLSADGNGYTTANDVYRIMSDYFHTLNTNKDYFSDDVDTFRESAKNAYIFAMMAKYWQAHILPPNDDMYYNQSRFMQYYRYGIDVHYSKAENDYVKYILEQYSKGQNGFYYRIVPRAVDWIFSTSVFDTLDNIYDISKTTEADPYCTLTECLYRKNIFTNLNNTVNEKVWNMCD